MTALPAGFLSPPRAFSLAPFWFWNDDLDADEICRQIDDFHDHGVYAFVIHPRVGLPESLGFMSDALLGYMRVAVEHAASRDMWVILYDEGMYPSGSAGGLVVQSDPALACRGLVRVPLPEGEPRLEPDHRLVTITGEGPARTAIVDRPIDSWVRGLHYLNHDAPREPDHGRHFDLGPTPGPPNTAETRPPAADLLNPASTDTLIRIVYEGYASALGDHFGSTVRAIFTDEPMVLGRGNPHNARPGQSDAVDHACRWFGRDIRSELPLLWEDSPEGRRFSEQYDRAIRARLEQTYYRPLYEWCGDHGINLTGHPADPDDLGIERWFHWPGQDVICHEVRPGRSATRGRPSTQAKVAASSKAHHQRPRNANEYMGAYGHHVTRELMEWVTNWLIVRGCDLLIPHAFYYSVRGPRIDECPPQLGPNSPLWPDFRSYAETCQRLCWLNGVGRPVVPVAVLAESNQCPSASAEALLTNQIDFHYLQRELQQDAELRDDGLHVGGTRYEAVVVEDSIAQPGAHPVLQDLSEVDRLIVWDPNPCTSHQRDGITCKDAAELVVALEPLGVRDVLCNPATPTLRARHVEVADGVEMSQWYMLWNEGVDWVLTTISLASGAVFHTVDPVTLEIADRTSTATIELDPGQLMLLRC
ncbi:MAG: hypothetical protein AAF750_01095 [Planctomycetota bacterium]